MHKISPEKLDYISPIRNAVPLVPGRKKAGRATLFQNRSKILKHKRQWRRLKLSKGPELIQTGGTLGQGLPAKLRYPNKIRPCTQTTACVQHTGKEKTMEYAKLAADIIEKVGGKENVTNLGHCATRLRFSLKDAAKAQTDAIKATQGVVGVVNKGGQYQVIIGNEVNEVYAECVKLLDMAAQPQEDCEEDTPEEKKKGILTRALDIIAGSFFPIIPALAGAGMVKALLSLLVAFKWVDNTTETYQILNLIADAPYYFMPLLLAVSSAKKFKVNEYLAATVGCIFISPTLASLFSAANEAGTVVHFFGIPVTAATYTNSVIPVLLTMWLMSYVEPFFNKYVPKAVRIVFAPMFTLLVTAPIGLIVLGPIGTWLGDGLAAIVTVLNDNVSWLVPTLVGAFTPLLVMCGMHYGLIPIGVNMLAATGTDIVAGPGMLVSNIAQGGASLAVAIRAKKANIKSLATSCGVSAICGITEPAMYGISLRFKRPLIAAMIGGGVAGFFMGIFQVWRFAQVAPSIFALPSYIGPDGLRNMYLAAIACLISFAISFAVSFALGIDEEK